MMLTNWAGLSIHPTDEYVHWSDRDRVAKMHKLRAAWDTIINDGHKDALMILMQAAVDYEANNQAERDAGASL